MSFLLLLILFVTCAGLLAWGMLRKDGVYQFPFLAGATFFAFVLPQMIGLQYDRDLPEGALEKATVMTILCAFMCWAGYVWSDRPMRLFQWEFQEQKLLTAGTCLAVLGAYFFFEISRQPEEITSSTMWTGTVVAFRFFAEILPYGFALAALMYFKKKSPMALALALFASLFYVDRIFFSGRRGVTLEYLAIVVMGLWFGNKRVLPKWLILGGVIVGTLLLHSTGDYRDKVKQDDKPTWSTVTEIPYFENLKTILTSGGEEMRNVVYMMEATERTSAYDFGLFHWNTLIFNYVPAQWFGEEFKKSLTFDLPNVAQRVFGYEASVGSTITGIVDSFGSFWYLGCIKFFLIAAAMRKIYEAAIRESIVAQVFYMLILTPSLHTITHHTQWFISPWIHIGFFLVPALYLSRVPRDLSPCYPSSAATIEGEAISNVTS